MILTCAVAASVSLSDCILIASGPRTDVQENCTDCGKNFTSVDGRHQCDACKELRRSQTSHHRTSVETSASSSSAAVLSVSGEQLKMAERVLSQLVGQDVTLAHIIREGKVVLAMYAHVPYRAAW